MPRWLRSVLAGQGTVMFGVGAVMFLGGAKVHHLPEGAMSFWPWKLTPLSAQMLGAWLLALAVAAALTIWERDLSRLLVPAATYTAFGLFQLVVALRYVDQFRPDYPWTWAYLGVLVAITLTGAYGCWAATRRCPPPVCLPRRLEQLQAAVVPLARRACSVLRSRQRVSIARCSLSSSSSLRSAPRLMPSSSRGSRRSTQFTIGRDHG